MVRAARVDVAHVLLILHVFMYLWKFSNEPRFECGALVCVSHRHTDTDTKCVT